jgi:hypothetical protein
MMAAVSADASWTAAVTLPSLGYVDFYLEPLWRGGRGKRQIDPGYVDPSRRSTHCFVANPSGGS